MIFHVDTAIAPEAVYKKVIPLPFAHNVVWDKNRQVLWSAGDDHLYKFQYNFNCQKLDLIKKDSFQLPGHDAHDLFPVYGQDSLWFTNPNGVYTLDLQTKKVTPVQFKYTTHIKSVSSGPPADGWPVLIMKPKVQWWSDEVLDTKGNTIFQQPGMKIYKARWFLENDFSYPSDNKIKICES